MSVPLSTLTAGQAATVCGFAGAAALHTRLMQMGIVEGTEIELVRFAPAGDPVEIRVMGYALSLRGVDAAQVLVDNVHTP